MWGICIALAILAICLWAKVAMKKADLAFERFIEQEREREMKDY